MRARLTAFFACVVCVAVVLARCLPDLPVTPPLGCGSGVVDLDDGEACDPGDSGRPGCNSFCQIECEAGVVDDATSHCYFWTQPSIDSVDQATNACAAFNAHLVAFVDPDELTFVASGTKNLPNAIGGASWVALEKEAFKNEAGAQTYYVTFNVPELPGWAATCPGCFGYTDASDFALPPSGNPASCVDWRHALGVSWVQAGCNTGMNDAGTPNFTSVLCEREPPGTFSSPCGDGSVARTCIEVPVTRATKRYDLSPAATFQVARSDCTARGGSLVHFTSGAEREEVAAEVKAVTQEDFWIGLFFDPTASAWAWTDGSAAPRAFPTPWADLEPSVNAAGFAAAIHFAAPSAPNAYSTNLAYATDATITHPYVCEFAR